MSLRDRATALRELGRTGEALATYERSLELDPAASYTHLDYAKALGRAGRTAEAESETREAIRLAPGIAEAYFDLGVIAFQAGRLDEAATAFAEAWRLAPGDPAAGTPAADESSWLTSAVGPSIVWITSPDESRCATTIMGDPP